MAHRSQSPKSRDGSPHSVHTYGRLLFQRRLDGRRNSFSPASPSTLTPSPPTRPQRLVSEPSIASSAGGTFYQHRAFDMGVIVGDDIGSLSISPTGHDVVIATRKGLFLIDLDDPVRLPRFLPQGGTWEVAEVQWNPHISHAEYVVSTSSEKMLLWNLNTNSTTSIIARFERAHYRAVTDVNWHTILPDLVASCALDSWIHVWDIRAPMKPAASLSPFIASAAQVKWSTYDENLLASAHYSSLMVWDKRKGSVPLMTVKAHDAKTYGLSWSRSRRNEILTCSLDSTVKVWDVNAGVDSHSTADNTVPSLASDYDIRPLRVARTRYPVSRARALPFGDGFLTMPQRGENVLELWSHQHGLSEPVHTFDGLGEVAKEFVWRTRASNAARMPEDAVQLITWGKDRTLRFIPVDASITEKLGPSRDRAGSMSDQDLPYTSYATMAMFGPETKPALSQPAEVNPILNAVRARPELVAPVPLTQDKEKSGSGSGATSGEASNAPTPPIVPAKQPEASVMMTLGDAGGTSRTRRDPRHQREVKQDEWTRVVTGRSSHRKHGPNVGGVNANSGHASPTMRSTRTNSPIMASQMFEERQSSSPGRDEQANANALAEEIMAAMESVAPHKVETTNLDAHERRWILGLTGPWGDMSSIYLRVFFTFPPSYPGEGHPKVTFERHPLITLKRRAYMMSQLDNRRRRKRPIAACLRFLLGLPDERSLTTEGTLKAHSALSARLRETLGEPDASEIEDPEFEGKAVVRNTQETPVLKISQAVFGPNGILVCIFPPVQQTPKGSAVPVPPRLGPRTRMTVSDGPGATALSNALKLLREKSGADPRDSDSNDGDDSHAFDMMASLKPVSATPSAEATFGAFIAPHRVRVFLKDFSDQLHHGNGLDKTLAAHYSFSTHDPLTMCVRNASVARRYSRYDHERVWKTLQLALGKTARPRGGVEESGIRTDVQWGQNPLARKLLDQYYKEFLGVKDLQLLAMLAVLTLCVNNVRRAISSVAADSPEYQRRAMQNLASHPSSPHTPDYFTRPIRSRKLSEISNTASSSKGSWSSLSFLPFLAHQMTPNPSPPKQLSTSAEAQLQAIPRRALTTPNTLLSPGGVLPSPLSPNHPIPVSRKTSVSGPSSMNNVTSGATIATTKTWSQIASKSSGGGPKKKVICGFGVDRDDEYYVQSRASDALLEHSFVRQLVAHIRAYADILDRWGLATQRAAILKFIPHDHRLLWEQTQSDELAHDGGAEGDVSQCCICRLPVNGLSHACLYCFHIAHYKCWSTRKGLGCPSGCGCLCDGQMSPIST